MAADLEINIEDHVTPSVSAFLQTISPAGMTELNRLGSRAALNGARAYHREFDSRGGWFNRSLPTWGAGRTRTQWPLQVYRAWSVQGLTADGFRLNNSHPHYRFKVNGGTISSSKWLTIPMAPEAHGRTTKQYERVTGNRLFRPRGHDVLMARVNGVARTIYALKKSVTQKPWPGALPPEARMVDPYIEVITKEIIAALEEE